MCAPNHNLGTWKWSYAGLISDLPSYVQISEPQDSYWNDNYLHFPSTERPRYSFSNGGPIEDSWNTQLLEPGRTTNGWDNNYFGVRIITTLATMSPKRENDNGYPAKTLPLLKFGAPYNPSAAFASGEVKVLFNQYLYYSSPDNVYDHSNWISWKSSLGFDSSSRVVNLGNAVSLSSYRQKLCMMKTVRSWIYFTQDNGPELQIAGSYESPSAASGVEFGDKLYIFFQTSSSGLAYSTYDGTYVPQHTRSILVARSYHLHPLVLCITTRKLHRLDSFASTLSAIS